MDYEEIKKLAPRFESFERQLIALARHQKRSGTFNADTFFYDYIKSTITSTVGFYCGREPDDPLGTAEVYQKVCDYFYNLPAFDPTPEIPEIAIFTDDMQSEDDLEPAGKRINQRVNQFIEQNVCRLISCDVKFSDCVFFATIVYIPYC